MKSAAKDPENAWTRGVSNHSAAQMPCSLFNDSKAGPGGHCQPLINEHLWIKVVTTPKIPSQPEYGASSGTATMQSQNR